MGHNWRKKNYELQVKGSKGEWMSETLCRLFYPDLYRQRLNELV